MYKSLVTIVLSVVGIAASANGDSLKCNWAIFPQASNGLGGEEHLEDPRFNFQIDLEAIQSWKYEYSSCIDGRTIRGARFTEFICLNITTIGYGERPMIGVFFNQLKRPRRYSGGLTTVGEYEPVLASWALWYGLANTSGIHQVILRCKPAS